MLKHLRHIRNSLAHGIGDTVVSYNPDDITDIRYFYNLIMKQQDPLALCRKREQNHKGTRRIAPVSDIQTIRESMTTQKKPRDSWFLPVAIGFTILLGMALAAILYYAIVMLA